ncbi:NHL domain-containing protein [Cephalotus follicularis]|uniref:NHL domain-containing protein n=1 Tax=Cephalotus follicularis TaxID=3775 RepID=A0A1Q3AYA6_CEPFO|nr:NHL domain-containing protein [Cephalotus follicularis]
MRESFLVLILATLAVAYSLQFQADAAPAGPLIKHLSSFIKWTRTSSKTPQSDGNIIQFEDGYLVETVVEGNEIGVVPYQIRVSEDGELYAVDEVNNNIVKITPPLSQYSRGRLVAGSFQGYSGHVDGKPSEARFNHPKGVTMDDKGNVYVADTLNLAIRKIGDAGVTTIAGGKSNVVGYRDGPSEDAKFSNDFDLVYVRPTCSLLVVDRGNAALRQISLNQEDCDYQDNSISATDILMVIGAVLIGYATCILQQGFRPSFFSTMQSSEKEFKDQPMEEKPTLIVESVKEEPGWPSFGQLVTDLFKIILEAFASMLLYFIPFRFRSRGYNKGLTPLKDSLRMPDDEVEPVLVQRQSAPAPLSETRQVHTPNTSEKYSEMKPPKGKSTSFKDPSLSNKHRSSKRQEYSEFYGSGEAPPHSKSKSQKERTRHRQRDKSGEVDYGVVGTETKPVEMKPVNYDNPQFDHYNIRSKYGSNASFRF